MSASANQRAALVNHAATDFALLAARWSDGLCPVFTCEEADAIAVLLSVALGDPAAERFIDAHSQHDDDPADQHHRPEDW